MARQSRQAQSRAYESRRANHRPELQTSFQSSLHIPQHEIPDGMTYAWVRAAWFDKPDNSHVSAKIRGGWQPVLRSQHPNLYGAINIPGVTQTNETHIVEGGLILCQMPTKDFKKRRAQLDAENRAVMEGVQGLDAIGAPTFNNSSRTQIERVSEEPEFQDD